MFAYERYNNGEMSDYIPTEEELAAARLTAIFPVFTSFICSSFLQDKNETDVIVLSA